MFIVKRDLRCVRLRRNGQLKRANPVTSEGMEVDSLLLQRKIHCLKAETEQLTKPGHETACTTPNLFRHSCTKLQHPLIQHFSSSELPTQKYKTAQPGCSFEGAAQESLRHIPASGDFQPPSHYHPEQQVVFFTTTPLSILQGQLSGDNGH